MNRFKFTAIFGDQERTIVLSNPHGGEGYQILIDNYYHGMLVKLNNQWIGHLNNKSDITAEDIQILGDMIDNK